MTAWLPPNLLAYFTPREPLKYAPPLDHLPWDTKARPYTGVGHYARLFEVRRAEVHKDLSFAMFGCLTVYASLQCVRVCVRACVCVCVRTHMQDPKDTPLPTRGENKAERRARKVSPFTLKAPTETIVGRSG